MRQQTLAAVTSLTETLPRDSYLTNGVSRVRSPFEDERILLFQNVKIKKAEIWKYKNERDEFVVKKERDEKGKAAGVL